jgi:hypothetical protein
MTYRALFDYFTKVADKSPIPIILHNLPSVTLIDLPADLCIELAEHPNIVGLKECSHNVNYIYFGFKKALFIFLVKIQKFKRFQRLHSSARKYTKTLVVATTLA